MYYYVTIKPLCRLRPGTTEQNMPDLFLLLMYLFTPFLSCTWKTYLVLSLIKRPLRGRTEQQ